MYNFTIRGRGRGVYTKLKIANKIKSRITYLISNSNADIYFFTNIEIGSEYVNPHVHSQIWSDDKDAVAKIYDTIIKEFSLVKKHCKLSLSEKDKKFYTYVIKDYAEDLNDNQVWNIEQTKKRMRNKLEFKLRFISKSKDKYTSALYKMVYRTYGILRAEADRFIEFLISIFHRKYALNTPQQRKLWSCFLVFLTEFLFVKKSMKRDTLDSKKEGYIAFISSFITIKNKAFDVLLMSGKRSMSPTVVSETYGKGAVLGILFFSPANDPPLSWVQLLRIT